VPPWTLPELAVLPIPSNPQQQSCRVFRGLSDVHEAIEAFVRRYNAHWRIRKLGFLIPLAARQAACSQEAT